MAVFLRKKGSLLMLYSSGSIKFNALLEMPTDSATGWIVSELGITIQGHLGSKL
jgi:hypothetical protein